MSKTTPMIQQYWKIKEQYPDCILFFRMGDFYEMFFEDAKLASRALEITLTSRNKGSSGQAIPLCGVPYHAADNYLARLVETGFKVAICEQVEDPGKAKGIVRRSVTRVLTPGTSLDPQALPQKAHRYIMSIASGTHKFGIAFMDYSTGEFRATELERIEEVLDEIARLDPKELLVPDSQAKDSEILERLKTQLNWANNELSITSPQEWAFEPDKARETLEGHFRVKTLEGFGLEGYSQAVCAAGALLQYIRETQAVSDTGPATEVGGQEPISLPRPLAHITDLKYYQSRDYMILDESTKRNLELTKTLRDGKLAGSLLNLMDHTSTPMGGRLLLDWLTHPLMDPERIEARLDAVEFSTDEHAFRLDLRERLEKLYDLERLTSRASTGSAHARDLAAIRDSLRVIPQVTKFLTDVEVPILARIGNELDHMPELLELLQSALVDDPPIALRDGKIIRPGYNAELDELSEIQRDGKSYIARLEAQERERTGISSLKVGYNKVFGYYLEVTRVHSASVPEHYIRKQTLVNAERFITPELKEIENKVLGAEEKLVELHYELFVELRDKVADQAARLMRNAGELARLDVVLALGELAAKRDFVRPEVGDHDIIDIRSGRHPVIQELVKQEMFVPNDVLLDNRENQILVITGPNMAGKSTVLRQTALIVLMAQMGSFVPADSAHIGVVDRIFTRVGASDILTRGMSTFMVEMTETANILRYATRQSLILLDEIGRGTSTFDGLSIAWAVTEYLHDNPDKQAKTMFATHYHELVDLAETKGRVKNFNIAVKEWEEQIIFLRTLVPGGTSRSYGIQVARLAGLPIDVIQRAKQVLANLESIEHDQTGVPSLAQEPEPQPAPYPQQLNFLAQQRDQAAGSIMKDIRSTNLNNITPIEALTLLDKWKKILDEQ